MCRLLLKFIEAIAVLKLTCFECIAFAETSVKFFSPICDKAEFVCI